MMLFDIIDCCRDTIAACDEPQDNCTICLGALSDEPFLRTDCFHFFHRSCMGRCVRHLHDNPHIVCWVSIQLGHLFNDPLLKPLLCVLKTTPGGVCTAVAGAVLQVRH